MRKTSSTSNRAPQALEVTYAGDPDGGAFGHRHGTRSGLDAITLTEKNNTLYRESAGGARVMCVAVHPYVSGVPHRIKYFNQIFDYMKKHEGVVFMTGAEVLDWYLEATAG